MKDRNKAKWLKIKALGRNKYTMLYGVLLWGVVLTTITSLIQYFLTLHAPDADSLSVNYVVARFIVFGVIGFFAATGRWMSLQRKYEPSGSDTDGGAEGPSRSTRR